MSLMDEPGATISGPGHVVAVASAGISTATTQVCWEWTCSCTSFAPGASPFFPTLQAGITAALHHAGLAELNLNPPDPNPVPHAFGTVPFGPPRDGTHRCNRCGHADLNRTDLSCWKCGSLSIEEI